MTNLATGDRTLTPVSIDPTTQSLQDVANALSAVPGIQAVTNAQTGTLQVLANPGFAFDFAGQIPSSRFLVRHHRDHHARSSADPTPALPTTTLPFQVVGSGTVGVTSGLSLEVKAASGAILANLNIGQGYSPGSSLTVANGITVQLSSGTANATAIPFPRR